MSANTSPNLKSVGYLSNDLLGKAGQHVLIVGQTGSGKTIAAEKLVKRAHNILVLDIKHSDAIAKWGFDIFYDLDDLRKACDSGLRRAVWRPSPFSDLQHYDEFYQYVYMRENTLAYCDEAAMVTRGAFTCKHLKACLMLGREKGISIYNACQRPIDIAQTMISEASLVYSFVLQLEQDIDKLQRTFAYDLSVLRQAPEHAFYVCSIRRREPAGWFKFQI